MSLFYNNYQKLKQENDDETAKLTAASSKVIDKMFRYISSSDASLFEMEVIRKDLIGTALEADMEKQDLREKLGVPEKEFCDSLLNGVLKRSKLERIIVELRPIIGFLILVYSIDYLADGMPKSYGIYAWTFAFVLVLVAGEHIVREYFIEKIIYKEKKHHFLTVGFGLFSVVLAILSFICIPDVFLIRGNGRVLLTVVWLLGAIVFLGSNLYWDECSKKYNWR